jgi:hypothetical protein
LPGSVAVDFDSHLSFESRVNSVGQLHPPATRDTTWVHNYASLAS